MEEEMRAAPLAEKIWDWVHEQLDTDDDGNLVAVVDGIEYRRPEGKVDDLREVLYSKAVRLYAEGKL